MNRSRDGKAALHALNLRNKRSRLAKEKRKLQAMYDFSRTVDGTIAELHARIVSLEKSARETTTEQPKLERFVSRLESEVTILTRLVTNYRKLGKG